MNVIDTKDIKIEYHRNSTKVIDSYKLSDDQIRLCTTWILLGREIKKLKITRSKASYIHEIKAHKRLYRLHLFRSHTKDTDLEEPIKLKYKIMYFIVGGF